MRPRRRVAQFLFVILLGSNGFSAEAPPTSAQIATLLEAAVGSDRAAAAKARRRLSLLSRRYPAILKDELLGLRARENFLAEVLKRETGSRGLELFFAEKLREAQRLYREDRYHEAEAICTALLVLGARESVKLRAKRLLHLAQDRAFAGDVLFVDLRAENEVVEGDQKLGVVLVVANRSDEPVTLTRSPTGILGQLQINFTTIGAHGEFFGRGDSKDLRVSEERILLSPGDSWEHTIALDAGRREGTFLVERVSIQGQLVPAHIEAGGRTRTRTLRVPFVAVLRVPEGRSEVAKDPFSGAAGAIESGDPEALVVGIALIVWEGEIEGAVRLLLRGTAAAAPGVAETSFILLRLLSGENYGRDRTAWIKYFLRHERLPIGGPLSDW